MRQINIRGVANGISVVVGCQEFVFDSNNLDEFARLLVAYIKNPMAVEQEMAKKFPQTVGLSGVGPIERAQREMAQTATDRPYENLGGGALGGRLNVGDTPQVPLDYVRNPLDDIRTGNVRTGDAIAYDSQGAAHSLRVGSNRI